MLKNVLVRQNRKSGTGKRKKEGRDLVGRGR